MSKHGQLHEPFAVLFFTAPKAHQDITVGIAPAPGGAFLRGTF